MPNPIHLWDDDQTFVAESTAAEGRSLVDRVRLYMLYQLALQTADLPGDAAEVGVYQGGTAKLLGPNFARSGKTLHLFDTFAGMPPTDPSRDWHKAGDFADTSLQEVQKFLTDAGDLQFHPGSFPSSVTQAVSERTFGFVHVDVDIHQSVLDCCDFFYPRLVTAGVIVFDDYGFRTCPGAKAAVDFFFTGRAERPIYLPTGQAIIIKKP